MNDWEFLLSKIDGAVTRISDLGLVSYASSTLLSLVAVLLALSTVLPISILNTDRTALLISTVVVLGVFIWLLRHLGGIRNVKLGMLRNWQLEVFSLKDSLKDVSERGLKQMSELIDCIEDSSKSAKSTFYRHSNEEFGKALKSRTEDSKVPERTNLKS